ncbi:FecR family protein [Flavobacterium sp. W21_SRS_FM6]|uniref:FecR family protein n=1 Tax=Flavobacterium sp. W21_SRS_FM6 TaxID=3240268 RepID=UPI003F91CD05
MSNVYDISDQAQINKQAAIWVTRLDRGLTKAELKELQHWLKNERNERELFMMASTWDKLDSFSQLSTLFQPAIHNNSGKFERRTYLIAASVIFCSLFVWLFTTFSLTEDESFLTADKVMSSHSTYQTAVGQHSTINLSDGSILTINTNSFVTVDFNANERLIKLVKGEIFIDVAHDTSRPLSVIADDTVFQAVGTAFNVKKVLNESIELLVTDGKVLIAELKNIKRSVDAASGIKMAMDLPSGVTHAATPGDMVIIKSSQTSKQKRANLGGEDIKVSLGWLDRKLIFKGETLQDAMNEVSRYTDSKFIIPEENLRNQKIAGVFKTDDIEVLLNTLSQNFNIHHERTQNGNILLVSK